MNVGDRVRYAHAPKEIGTIRTADHERSLYPYRVLWDDGVDGLYAAEDLIPLHAPPRLSALYEEGYSAAIDDVVGWLELNSPADARTLDTAWNLLNMKSSCKS